MGRDRYLDLHDVVLDPSLGRHVLGAVRPNLLGRMGGLSVAGGGVDHRDGLRHVRRRRHRAWRLVRPSSQLELAAGGFAF